jgi:hypothetical protein
MKALSLTQPWATLVVTGEKEVETRSWRTNHSGMIAIHASKGFRRGLAGKPIIQCSGRQYVGTATTPRRICRRAQSSE